MSRELALSLLRRCRVSEELIGVLSLEPGLPPGPGVAAPRPGWVRYSPIPDSISLWVDCDLDAFAPKAPADAKALEFQNHLFAMDWARDVGIIWTSGPGWRRDRRGQWWWRLELSGDDQPKCSLHVWELLYMGPVELEQRAIEAVDEALSGTWLGARYRQFDNVRPEGTDYYLMDGQSTGARDYLTGMRVWTEGHRRPSGPPD